MNHADVYANVLANPDCPIVHRVPTGYVYNGQQQVRLVNALEYSSGDFEQRFDARQTVWVKV